MHIQETSETLVITAFGPDKELLKKVILKGANVADAELQSPGMSKLIEYLYELNNNNIFKDCTFTFEQVTFTAPSSVPKSK